MKPGWLACSLVLLAGCASQPAPVAGCASGAVRLLTDVACGRTGPAGFALVIMPEAEPINPSPWYAFEIDTDASVEVEVSLYYGNHRHRYVPKQRVPGGAWRALPGEAVEVLGEGERADIRLDVPAGGAFIAAQEVLSVEEREVWSEDFAARHGFERYEIGRSVNGHPIHALLGGAGQGAPLILLLGGQHPPEVPGTLGLRAFLETLAAEGGSLLETHRVLVAPELNPDGVEGGYWRLNTGLVDLNRDWGPFTQPETQAVRAEIDRQLEAGHRPVLMLDFHATRRNVYYTPANEDALEPPGFASAWIEEIDRIYEGEQPEVSASHNAGLPTAKVWFAETFAAPGITVEYGDETGRAEIAALSAAGAHALINLLAPVQGQGD